MADTSVVGLVGYSDTPDVFFRVVYPQPDDPDTVLDDPKWITDGCDLTRDRTIIKVAKDDPRIQMVWGGTVTDDDVVVSNDGN